MHICISGSENRFSTPTKYYFCISSINNITLEVAVESNSRLAEPALGIEHCECPPQYSGLSCQVSDTVAVNNPVC